MNTFLSDNVRETMCKLCEEHIRDSGLFTSPLCEGAYCDEAYKYYLECLKEQNIEPITVVFTDIDGVLIKDNHQRVKMVDGFPPFSKSCVTAYNELIRLTGAKTVISSDWRKWEDLESLKMIFSNRCVDCDIISMTDILSYQISSCASRGQEIANWLERHPEVTNYVILDDIIDTIKSKHPDNYIECDENIGLTEELMRKALEILKS